MGAISYERGTPVHTRTGPFIRPPLLLAIQAVRSLYRGTSLIRNRPTPLGPPQEPRHGPTVGSYGMAASYKRGTPVGECIQQFQGSRENLGASISSKTACATADFLLGGSASAVGVEATLYQGSVRGTPVPRHSQGLQGVPRSVCRGTSRSCAL